MPETTLEISVSQRETNRPRLLEALAVGSDGAPLAGLNLRLEIESDGTFNEQAELKCLEIVTGTNGVAYFQWWEYPREGPGRDFVSVVRALWESEAAHVYLQDLYE